MYFLDASFRRQLLDIQKISRLNDADCNLFRVSRAYSMSRADANTREEFIVTITQAESSPTARLKLVAHVQPEQTLIAIVYHMV